MEKLAILLTAFEQVKECGRQIEMVRQSYKVLKDIPILIVTTSPKKGIFDYLTSSYKNVAVAQWDNAPGNDDDRIYSNDKDIKIAWRQKYLVERILRTMEYGLVSLYFCGMDAALHLHSDSFYKPSAESLLIKEYHQLIEEELLFIGDLDYDNEHCSNALKVVQQNLHYHPESILFNLKEANRIGYKLWGKEGFIPHNSLSIEAIFPELANYSYCGNNILTYNDIPCEDFYRKVKSRCIRGYHGEWNHLINYPGVQ